MGVNGIGQFDVFKKYGISAYITDLAILTGGSYMIDRKGYYYTSSSDGAGDVIQITPEGYQWFVARSDRTGAVRPVLKAPSLFSQITKNRVKGNDGTEEVEYGEYPQYAVDPELAKILDR